MNKLNKKNNFKKSVDDILLKYPDRKPIFVYRSKTDKVLPLITKNKFLVPNNMTLGQFLVIIRNKIDIDAKISIFLFVNDRNLPCYSNTIENIYDEFKNKDNMLVITYSGENTFGN